MVHALPKRNTGFLLAAMVLPVTSCADAGTAAEELDNIKIELQPTVEPVKTPDLQPAVTPIQPYDRNSKARTEPMEDWEMAYLEYLDSYDDRDIAEYAFTYVDEDDIPELAVSSGWMLNSKVLTFHDDKVNALEISYYTVHYLVGSGKWYELDENGNEVDEYIYEWDGEKVTEEEYEQREKDVFPAEMDEHQHPVYLYSYDELYSLLGGE